MRNNTSPVLHCFSDCPTPSYCFRNNVSRLGAQELEMNSSMASPKSFSHLILFLYVTFASPAITTWKCLMATDSATPLSTPGTWSLSSTFRRSRIFFLTCCWRKRHVLLYHNSRTPKYLIYMNFLFFSLHVLSCENGFPVISQCLFLISWPLFLVIFKWLGPACYRSPYHCCVSVFFYFLFLLLFAKTNQSCINQRFLHIQKTCLVWCDVDHQCP